MALALLLLVFCAIGLLLALNPGLDLWAAHWFAGDTPIVTSQQWWWVEWINAWTPLVFRLWLGLCFLLWLGSWMGKRWQRWRMPLLYVVIAGIIGPGLAVGAIKEQVNRARPYQVQDFGGTAHFTPAGQITDQCAENCSFVSGHVACGYFFCTLALLSRKRTLWLATGVCAGLLIGFARMSAMGHWLSDVVWAFPITVVPCWLVWRLMRWAQSCLAQPSSTVG